MYQPVLFALSIVFFAVSSAHPSFARDGALLKRLRERQAERASDTSSEASRRGLFVQGRGTSSTGYIGERHYILYLPHGGLKQPSALLVVLHGGMGNAKQIQSYIGLEPYADRYGFAIAYPNGTAVTSLLSDKRAGWNAGECCGQSQASQTDDVGFITAMVQQISANHPIDSQRIYGIGHSNGAMMTYRMLCESPLYSGAALYAGALEIEVQQCPLARGKPILALHGAQDENVPPEGGYSRNGINKKTNYRSQAYSQSVFTRSGAGYTHIMLPHAAHQPETINADLLATEGVTLPQKLVTFLGLAH